MGPTARQPVPGSESGPLGTTPEGQHRLAGVARPVARPAVERVEILAFDRVCQEPQRFKLSAGEFQLGVSIPKVIALAREKKLHPRRFRGSAFGCYGFDPAKVKRYKKRMAAGAAARSA